MDSEVFEDAPYTEREAWEWMIAEAHWKEREKPLMGKRVKLKRGQFSHSLRFMAERFKWSKDKTARYLKKLELWDMVKTESATGQNIITICNYSKYQDDKTAPATAPATGARQERDKEEENQEIQEGEEEGGLFSEKELRQFRKQCPSLSETEFKNQVTNCEIWITANGSRTPELTLSKWLQREESEKQKIKPASNGLQAFQEIMEQTI